MKKVLKKMAVIGFIFFLLLQLYQPPHNIDYGEVSSAHFSKTYSVPQKIETILQNSCYDCHSNHTNYLWYDDIQPINMLVDNHIKKGKENLNFSEWGNYSRRKQHNKLDRIIKQVNANEMPLYFYTILHRNASLSESNKKDLIDWINTLKNKNNE